VIRADKSIDKLHNELIDAVKQTIESVKQTGQDSISPLWVKPEVDE